MSHSKRNTSLAFFTAHERAELRGTWGSQATRLTRDSFLPFGSCQLCLLPAREPVACPDHGHLFCRECAVTNLVAQNEESKRLRREAERRRQEDEVQREAEDAEAHEIEVTAFERAQAGLRTGNSAGRRGVKRALEKDEGREKELESERRNDAKRRAAAAKDGGEVGEASFWVPSRIPDNVKRDLDVAKQTPTCPAAEADKPHGFSLKSLVNVKFNEKISDEIKSAEEGGAVRTCPSCNKALSNASRAVLAKPCGHVLCKSCSDKFQVTKPKSAHDLTGDDDSDTIRCYVCQEDITPGRRSKKSKSSAHNLESGGKKSKESKIERGIVEISSEGTGFAGGGRNLVKKHGLAFQC